MTDGNETTEGARCISRHSTYEEVWAYLQTFRPSEAERAEWDDGTHTTEIKRSAPAVIPGGRSKIEDTVMRRSWEEIEERESGGGEGTGAGVVGAGVDAGVGVGVGVGAPSNPCMEVLLDNRPHRDGGKPANISFHAALEKFGKQRGKRKQQLRQRIEMVEFYERGIRRRDGGKPYRVEMSIWGEVTAALFNDQRDCDLSHRVDGPAVVRARPFEGVIELTYAVRGETVEVVVIKKTGA